MLHDDSLLTTDDQGKLGALWPSLDKRERGSAFQALPRKLADDSFLSLGARDRYELLFTVPEGKRRIRMRLPPPDDAADLIELTPTIQSELLLDLVDSVLRSEVTALLAFNEDQAGGPMSPVCPGPPGITINEAISGQTPCPEYVCSAVGCL
jgi:magnesium transporter